jgi:hypothetical protein
MDSKRMNLTRILPVAIGALAVLEGGCRHSAHSATFEFVDPTRVQMPATDASQLRIERSRTIFVDAVTVEPLALPVWPEIESSLPSQPLVFKVRILVGENGRVQGVKKSIADFSLPSHVSSRCFEAIRVAVDQWRFEPAQLMVLEPQEDGRPLVVSSSPESTSFEVAFSFSSTGKVDSVIARD